MRTKHILYLLLFLTGIYSCDLMGDVDQIKPYYQLDEGSAIRDEKTAVQATMGIYTGWFEYGTLGAFRPLLGLRIGSMGTGGRIWGDEGFSDNTVEPDNSLLGGVYQALYTIINRANYVITTLEGNKDFPIDAEKKEELLGESKFHRAMAHFYLLRYFGQFYDLNSKYGVVLRSKPFKGGDLDARETVANGYRFILEDLEYAVAHAPASVSRHCFVSRLTARALLAKVLLCKGDWVGAAREANAVIESAAGQQQQLDSYGNIFRNPYDSPEMLFAPYPPDYAMFWDSRITNSETSRQLADELVPGAANDSTGIGLDPRYAFTYATDSLVGNTQKNGKYPKRETVTYYYLRLGEIYYISAEAEARQGSDHYALARTRLQAVLDKHCGKNFYDVSGIVDGKELLETIRKHKWLDLLTEGGEEWFDAVRYHKAGDLDIRTIKSTITTEHQLTLPIPKDAIGANHLLVQNP